MPEPISAIGASSAVQYAMAITRKQHDQQDQDGKQAVQLIESSAQPSLTTSGSVGTKLNVVA